MIKEDLRQLRGKNLRRLLKERHITQENFANALFVAREQVNRWCKNGTDLFSNVEDWEEYFGVEHGYFDKRHNSRSSAELIDEMKAFLNEQYPNAVISDDGRYSSIEIRSFEIAIEDTARFGDLLKETEALNCSVADGETALSITYNLSDNQSRTEGKKK